MEGVFFSNAAATPAKRPSTEMANGASKRRPRPPPPPIVISPGQAAFRILCHVSKTGGVIGKSGSIIKLFRQETGAKIRVEEAVPDCDERVILVVGPENPKKRVCLSQQSLASSTEGEEVVVSAAQEALIRVFERVLEVEAENEGATAGVATCKLLAATSQVGPVMGKGGKNIEKIRKESGAKIKVMAVENLQVCAAPSDELIQISGSALSVKKALVAVSRCLQESPPSEKPQTMSRAPVTVSHGSLPNIHGDLSYRSSALPPSPGNTVDYVGVGRPVPTGGDRISTLDLKKPHQEVSFKLLCSNDKVGGVIGKGGTIVRALQNETGASISVAATIPDSVERVITVLSSESPESRFSPAQNAIVRVFNRSVEAGMERGGESGVDMGPITARLLVPSSHIGCLMGKGGAIISEMRKVTGTCIRILGGDQVPKCASENEEVVQIAGELSKVQDALFHVTSRLRDNAFPTKISNGSGIGIHSSTLREITSYGRHETNSPRMYSSLGLSHNIDRQTTLAHSMDHLGLSSNIDRPSSPTSWASQTFGGVNPRGMTDLGRGLAPTRGGIELGSGSKSAIVTNTTIEIVVPEHVMPLVYGEHGTNLSRIRQISGATVIVRDPLPGAAEGMVIISGTPDQSQAAQSLLQAFILSGRTAPDPRYRRL